MAHHRITVEMTPEVQVERDDGSVMPVGRHLRRFFARCDCGWEGSAYVTSIVALEDGEAHLAEVREGVT